MELYREIPCRLAAQAHQVYRLKSQLHGSHVSSNPMASPFFSSLLSKDHVSMRPPYRSEASRRRTLLIFSDLLFLISSRQQYRPAIPPPTITTSYGSGAAQCSYCLACLSLNRKKKKKKKKKKIWIIDYACCYYEKQTFFSFTPFL